MADVPVAVLSNNDGCIIARSHEVKKLGIPMGAPMFEYKEVIARQHIRLFSANFTLYGDMSQRVMEILSDFTPSLEVYSIDEAFMDLSNQKIPDWDEFIKQVRSTVLQWTGIPVSIGLGSTKTLAKIANKIAKKNPATGGTFSLLGRDDPDYYLDQVEVGDIWGVGRQYTKYLNSLGIFTARDLKYAQPYSVKKHMTVMGERTQLELNGVSCIPLQPLPKRKKMIASTRSFGHYQESLDNIANAVAYFCNEIGEKLRQDHSKAVFMQVFILTNLYNKSHRQYHKSITIKMFEPTSYTPDLIYYAVEGLKRIYRSGYKYKKAGVLALGIIPESELQYDLIGIYDPYREQRQAAAMRVVDRINRSMNRGTVKFAAEGVDRTKWWMNQTMKSRRFTTKWEELLEIKV